MYAKCRSWFGKHSLLIIFRFSTPLQSNYHAWRGPQCLRPNSDPFPVPVFPIRVHLSPISQTRRERTPLSLRHTIVRNVSRLSPCIFSPCFSSCDLNKMTHPSILRTLAHRDLYCVSKLPRSPSALGSKQDPVLHFPPTQNSPTRLFERRDVISQGLIISFSC